MHSSANFISLTVEMDQYSGDTLLKSCDPVLTDEDALRPIITALLPVKGLRHDICGNLTTDAINTIFTSIQSLGIAMNEEASRDAIFQEARITLCRIYAQYTYLINSFATAVSRSEAINPKLIDLLREKLQMMSDILSVSRYIILHPPLTLSGATIKEGFQQPSNEDLKLFEAFNDTQALIDEQKKKLATKNMFTLKERALETSSEKNVYMSRQLNIYAFMNIVAVGLIFYIISV